MNKLVEYLQRLRLNTKLMLAIGCVLLIAFAIGFQGVMNTRAANNKMDEIYKSDLMGISHIKEANINLIYIARSLQQMMLAIDTEHREESYIRLKLAEKTLHSELDKAKKEIIQPYGLQMINKFEAIFRRHTTHIEKIIKLIRQEPPRQSVAAIQFIALPEFTSTLNEADDLLTAISVDLTESAKDKLVAIRASSEKTEQSTLWLIIIGSLFALVLSGLISRAISVPIETLNINLQEIANGTLENKVPYGNYENEIGEMARSLQILQESSRKMSDINWIKESAHVITQAITGIDDDSSFVATLISKLANKLDVPLASFYRWNVSTACYQFQGGYGYKSQEGHPCEFMLGEGLVGQCASDAKSILLCDIPETYLRVSSGLGSSLPTCLFLSPIIGQDKVVLAVIEFASFEIINDRRQTLLRELIPMIALSIEKLDRNAVAKALLAETQRQSQDLQAQAESLRDSEEALRAQRDQLALSAGVVDG